MVEIKDVSKDYISGVDFDGVKLSFNYYDEESGEDRNVEILYGYSLVDKYEYSEDELSELEDEGYEIEEDVVLMPTVMVLFDGALDYEESDVDINRLLDKVVERYGDLLPAEELGDLLYW